MLAPADAKQSSKSQRRHYAGILNGKPFYYRLKKPPKKKPLTLADRIAAEFAPMLSVDHWFADFRGSHGNRWSQEEMTEYFRHRTPIKRHYHKKSHHPKDFAAWNLDCAGAGNPRDLESPLQQDSGLPRRRQLRLSRPDSSSHVGIPGTGRVVL